eukprot:GHVL01010769.1.p1 GENE.GHVL01010769.1~~GHVL01010769.1.p1  ORF type:complete len:205 (+),score=33.87 GHVL01010769.1:35-649(+)
MGRYEDEEERSSKSKKQSLLVRNLQIDTPMELLRETFSKHGDVRDIYMPRDYYTRKARGFGFVEFTNYQDAVTAMNALNHTVIDGNEIDIVLAQERRKSPQTMKRLEMANGTTRGGRRRQSPSYGRRSPSRYRGGSSGRNRYGGDRRGRSPSKYRRRDDEDDRRSSVGAERGRRTRHRESSRDRYRRSSRDRGGDSSRRGSFSD